MDKIEKASAEVSFSLFYVESFIHMVKSEHDVQGGLSPGVTSNYSHCLKMDLSYQMCWMLKILNPFLSLICPADGWTW